MPRRTCRSLLPTGERGRRKGEGKLRWPRRVSPISKEKKKGKKERGRRELSGETFGFACIVRSSPPYSLRRGGGRKGEEKKKKKELVALGDLQATFSLRKKRERGGRRGSGCGPWNRMPFVAREKEREKKRKKRAAPSRTQEATQALDALGPPFL